VVTAVIVVLSFRPMRPAIAVGLGLILGGALGNLADRALNGPAFGGPVTDFIDLHVWPIFNLADSAIVIGALLVAFASFDGSDERIEASSDPAPAGSGTEP
jgi:signal peptidase II